MRSKRKFPKGYKSPFRHFLMPLRNAHRVTDVYRCLALCRVKLFRNDHYKSEKGDKLILPVQLEQGGVKHIRAEFFNHDGSIDEGAVRVYFDGSQTSSYAQPDDVYDDGEPKKWVLGIYLMKSERVRRRVAKQINKRHGGFKKQGKTNAPKSGGSHRKKAVRGRTPVPKAKGRKRR